MREEKKAFTLVEILLYISLASIMLVTLSAFWITISNSRDRSTVMSNVNTEATFIMQKITQTIRDAEIINTPSAGNTDTSISIGMSTPADNPTIINFSGGNVTIKNGAAAPININSNTVIVTGLTFTNLTPAGGKGTVRLALTVSSINPDGVKNLSYTQTLYATATIK